MLTIVVDLSTGRVKLPVPIDLPWTKLLFWGVQLLENQHTDRPLRTIRQAQGLGLRETAELAGLDPAYLSRIERGRAGLSVENLARLAPILGLDQLARLLAPYAEVNGGDG